MALLKNKNFAFSTLASGIGAGDTSVTVTSGHGSRFPSSGDFICAIWGNAYPAPGSDPARELVKMSLTSVDTFVIERGQEDTSAKAWVSGDNIALVMSAGKMDEVEEKLQDGTTSFAVATGTNAYAAVLDPAISSYVFGQSFFVKFNNANTAAAPTLAFNGLTAKKIFASVGGNVETLSIGDIIAGMHYSLSYDTALDTGSGGWIITGGQFDSVQKKDTDASNFDFVLDEDNLSSNSAIKLPTQQSVKSYVDARIPQGGIIMWSGTIANIPTGWALCDGTNGTPDLTDRFIIPADADSGGTNNVGDSGGSKTITWANLPTHAHGAGTLATASAGAHTHNYTRRAGSRLHTGTAGGYDNNYGSSSAATSSNGSHSHSISGSTDQSGSSTDYMPKYYALAFIMLL